MEPDKAAQEMQQRVEKFERGTTWRHAMAARGAAAYGNRGTELFGPLGPGDGVRRSKRSRSGGWGSKHRWNVARAVCETFAEKLTGLDEPKTQMVATDAEWEIRRQGVWADRFIEGNMHEPAGNFIDGWDLARHGFLLAAVSTGTVAARIEEDYVAKRVRTQLRSTLNTFIDPADVANGQPLTFVDVTWENPEYLVEDERFKKHADWIMKCADVPPHHRGQDESGPFFGTPMVKLVSAWRLPFGKFEGRDARFVGGKSVHWDDWKFPTPPLAFFGMNRCIGDSFWAENFIEIMMSALEQADDVAATAENTMRRSSQTLNIYDSRATSPSEWLNAKDVVSLGYDGEKGSAPKIEKPGLLHSDYFAWMDRNIDMAKFLAGVPDMHILGQSPGGTDSGRAKRLEASLLPERHAKKQRNWRHWVAVDCAKLFLRAARRIGEREPDWQVTWPGQDFDAKVDVGVLDIDATQYVLRPYAVSEQKNTPADRAQAAQEMLDREEITNEQYSIIVNGAYDVPRESRGFSVQRRYVAMVLDEILYSDEDVIADENRYMAERYMPPTPWMDPAAARQQANEIYTQAMIDRVPQNRRNLMRRFLEDCDALIMKKTQETGATNAAQNATMSVEGDMSSLLGAGLAPAAGTADAAAAIPPGPGAAPPGAPVNVGGLPAVA